MELLKAITANKFFKMVATYAIVQVTAQDLGIKTGKLQRDLIQSLPVQILIIFSTSYVGTKDFRLAAIITAVYFGLKYILSKGETSNVCFEEV